MSFFNRIPALLVAVVIAAMPFAATVVSLQPLNAAAQAPAADAPKADAPATPAAAPAAAPVVAKETVENPYGLKHTIQNGDLVSKTVLALLLIMSMGSWYILIVKLFEQRRLLSEAKAAEATFFQAGTVKQGIDTLKEESAFRFIAESGVAATQHHEGMMGQVPLSDWITMSVQRASDNVSSRLSDGLAFLATVGSTSPFVGLFGTVWGILNALTAIGVAGQASIDKVAGPVGEALIMTAIGLAVAVPAVLSYNWLVRRNKQCGEKLRAFSADLHSVLLSTAAKK
jgi:biopolymer transport protein ExbB